MQLYPTTYLVFLEQYSVRLWSCLLVLWSYEQDEMVLGAEVPFLENNITFEMQDWRSSIRDALCEKY
jgi:hypothetical protein